MSCHDGEYSQIRPPGPNTSSSWGSGRWQLAGSHQSGWSSRSPECPTQSASQIPKQKQTNYDWWKYSLLVYLENSTMSQHWLFPLPSPSRVLWWRRPGAQLEEAHLSCCRTSCSWRSTAARSIQWRSWLTSRSPAKGYKRHQSLKSR